jgi:hypothetical protein
MAISENIGIPVVVTSGDLQVLTSGTAFCSPEKGLQVVVGGIRIDLKFETEKADKPEIERNPIPSELTFRYKIKGKVPSLPAGIGLKFPDSIGSANGIPIYFSFGLSALGDDQKAMTVQYTVYGGKPSPQPPTEQAGAQQ